MDLLKIGLVGSALLCSLVAGIVLTFTCVVMPGIKRLNDHDFLQSFKVMDRVIQDNQPVFMLVWVGSVVVLVVTAALGLDPNSARRNFQTVPGETFLTFL